MTNPFIPAQPQPQPQPQPSFQQGAATYGAPQPQYAPAGNGLVAQPGQFVPIGAPPADASGNMPRLADLTGRLILFLPELLEPAVQSRFRNDDGTARTQPRLTATLIVLDGGPVVWGGQTPDKPRMQEALPYVAKAYWITQTKIIAQLNDALQVRLKGGPGLAVGRLWKTGPGNSPYVLQEPNAQDVETYNRYVSHTNPFAL